MKSLTKAILCGGMLIVFGIFAQYRFGNNGSWIGGGLMLFSLGLGWYLCKIKQEEDSEKERKTK